MKTLPELFRRHAGRRVESAKYVRIVYQKRGFDSLGRGYVACASYSTKIWDPIKKRYVINKTGPGKKPARYVTVFVFLDTRLHVIVSCSCPDFKYRWEVALNQAEAAEIEYSNGEMPIVRNPNLRKTMCKHCIALYQKILPDLPKPKHDKSNPIGKPEVAVPPSVQRQRQKAAEDAARKLKVKPIKITTPSQTQNKSAKPSRKQSTLPRQKPAEPKKVAPPKPAPAMMTPKKSTTAPAAKSRPALKAAPQPARMTTPRSRVVPPPKAPPVPLMRAKK